MFGGFYAFPGGKVDPADRGPRPSWVPPGKPPCSGRPRHVSSWRRPASSWLRGPPSFRPKRSARRDASLHRRSCTTDFGAICHRHGLAVDATRLIDAGPAGSRRTSLRCGSMRPSSGSSCRRSQTSRALPEPEASGSEADIGRAALRAPGGGALGLWRAGARASSSRRSHNGRSRPSLPSRKSPRSLASRLRHPPMVQDHARHGALEFQEGLVLVPQRTPTLPPATHTNCYLAGRGELLIVDPGAADEGSSPSFIPWWTRFGRKDAGHSPLP